MGFQAISCLLVVSALITATLSEAAPYCRQAASPGSENPVRSSYAANQHPEGGPKTDKATPDANGIYNPGNGVLPPKVISSVDPEYTAQASKKKLSGSCEIQVVVDAQGNPR